MIEFIEDTQRNYQNRTYINAAKADATLAFAVDFQSSGEICTKKAAEKYNKLYIPILISQENFEDRINRIIEILQFHDIHTLNIAGNGISRLCKYEITQEMCDNFILNTLIKITNHIKIDLIRSGGQTGADESGLKAALKLNIPGICLSPKGWRFRTSTEDISNEQLFKQRFYGST